MSATADELAGLTGVLPLTDGAAADDDAPGQTDMSLAAGYFARIADMRARLEMYSTEDGTLTMSGAIGLAAELGVVLMDDKEDALDALKEMDQNGDGTIDPMEFEEWFKKQVLRSRVAPVEEQANLAATVAHGLSSGKFAQEVQREAARMQASTQSAVTVPAPKQKYSQEASRPANAYGTNAAAWAAFARLDLDESGTLDRTELGQMVESLNMKMGAKDLDRHFEKMDPLDTGFISFDAFCVFFNAVKAKERRKLIRKLKERFHKADVRDSGLLRQDEFERVVNDSRITLEPPFDREEDWQSCRKTRAGTFPDYTYELNYAAFESWYKERLGIDDPNIPVLPEFMVQKIEEAAFYGQVRKKWVGQTRSGRELWNSLRPRLLALVRMQQQWGKFHDIYEGSSTSLEYSDIRRGIRDPDSVFSAVWDLMQVILLLYVSVTVPLRAGFELTVELWTFAFFWDLLIDLFFVVDIFLNFRTAFYTSNGVREDRPKKIAENYLRGWFPVDFLSSLPLAYLTYLGSEDTVVLAVDGSEAGGGGQKGGSNTRALKALRLVRLSKMLRLARIKKVIQKYSENIHLQTFVSIGFTVFLILFLVHILACFFYLIGTADEERVMRDGTTITIHGWVNAQDDWEPIIPDEPTIPGTTGRYLASMYYVLNALENSSTDGEMGFALFAELMRDFILGMVAGLMATISMAMGSGDQEVQWKVRALKKWMAERKIPKAFQTRVSEHCNELWITRKQCDVEEVFRDVPPSMRLHLASFLYGDNVSNIPLFRDLGEAVIGAICSIVHPIYVLRGQEVISEGQPGSEFYMLMRGELEVLKGNQEGMTSRLGFLSEGSFFGETAILSETGSECRTRTVVAVTDSELIFITRDEVFQLGESFPELEARLRRFMKVGRQRLQRKGIDQNELSAIREYATTFARMRKEVKQHEADRAQEFVLAGDTIHVGSIPSFRPPHKYSMTEEMIADRFSEFGEVLTAVIRYREPEEGKPHNSWALVVFKDNSDVVRLMRSKKERKVPAKSLVSADDSGPSQWVEAKDIAGLGWSHTVRLIDPEQALESKGSFGKSFALTSRSASCSFHVSELCDSLQVPSGRLADIA